MLMEPISNFSTVENPPIHQQLRASDSLHAILELYQMFPTFPIGRVAARGAGQWAGSR